MVSHFTESVFGHTRNCGRGILAAMSQRRNRGCENASCFSCELHTCFLMNFSLICLTVKRHPVVSTPTFFRICADWLLQAGQLRSRQFDEHVLQAVASRSFASTRIICVPRSRQIATSVMACCTLHRFLRCPAAILGK